MLNDQELFMLCQRLGFSIQAQAVINTIRSSPPSRRVGSNGQNVAVQFASRKMGIMIQAESYKVELAGVYEKEHDPKTLEFYDQPPSINLKYKVGNRSTGGLYTPDFFVISADSAGWEEWKEEEEELIRLAEKTPNRYQRDERGQWRCPPGEEVAAPLGFYFRVRSSREINWILQRNLRFLSYYWRKNCPSVSTIAHEEIFSLVTAEPGITLDTLFTRIKEASSDDIYKLIADEQIYIDLYTDSIPELERSHIFRDREMAYAWSAMFTKSSVLAFPKPHTVSTEPNTPVLYDGCHWIILQSGKNDTQLLSSDKKLIKIPNERFKALVAEGSIIGIAEVPEEGSLNNEADERFMKASKETLEEANRRFKLIQPVLAGQASTDKTSLGRAMRRWVAKFREAEQNHGSGYIGLLPDFAKCGNRKSRLDENIIKIINDFIEKEYENHKQKNKREVYGEFENYCKLKGASAIPSYKTFVAAVNSRPHYEQIKKRAGSKAAYPFEPIYWELIYTLPKHGDYPFQIVHIDHTQLDTELVDSRTGKNLGRPWLTLLIDAYSRRILAVYITFDKPSYRSCMMALRECVYQHNRFPEMVAVDWGPEFQSIYFEALLARYGCSKASRPKAKPRFGSIMERIFNTTNEEFIHNLEGNTQATKNVRQMTKAVDPQLHAVWTLGTLYARLQEWAYEKYDTNEHKTLGQTPAEAFNQGLLLGGMRSGDLIPYDDDFVHFTLPSTSKGTAKLQPNLGVKIKHIYYWARGEVFRNASELEKKQIPVRYDPYDVSHAYAFVKGRWVECLSEYHTKFRGRTEREIQLASEELRSRHRRHGQRFTITAAKLAEFITSVEAQEILLAQRRKDAELREVFALMGKSDLGLHGVGIEQETPLTSNEAIPLANTSTTSFVEHPEESNEDDDEIYEVFIGE